MNPKTQALIDSVTITTMRMPMQKGVLVHRINTVEIYIGKSISYGIICVDLQAY